MKKRNHLQWAVCIALAGAFSTSVNCATQTEWLSLCGQCLNPSVSSKSGMGTANAVVEARITRNDAVAWCSNWHPEDSNCANGQLSSDEAKKTYRATANCTAGQLNAIDGKRYALYGAWTTGVGKGRARFRDGSGAVVAQDDDSGGLAIAQQWEILCPAPSKKPVTIPAKPSPATHNAH
jgi:hypothetical protein